MSRREGIPSVGYRCLPSSFRPCDSSQVRWLDYDVDGDLLLAWWNDGSTAADLDAARLRGFRYAAVAEPQGLVAVAAHWDLVEGAAGQVELAAVRTAPDRQAGGLATAVCSFITASIVSEGSAATCHTEKANTAMRAILQSLGYDLVEEYLERPD